MPAVNGHLVTAGAAGGGGAGLPTRQVGQHLLEILVGGVQVKRESE